MKVLYPNICYNAVCYKGIALYIVVQNMRLDKMHMQSQRETTMNRMLNTPSL